MEERVRQEANDGFPLISSRNRKRRFRLSLLCQTGDNLLRLKISKTFTFPKFALTFRNEKRLIPTEKRKKPELFIQVSMSNPHTKDAECISDKPLTRRGE